MEGSPNVSTGDDAALLKSVKDELEKKKNKRGGNWTLLIVTLLLFFSFGLLSWGMKELAILIGVILFHEMGHLLGMKMFRYQNVNMFFIPLFGAAVSGHKRKTLNRQ